MQGSGLLENTIIQTPIACETYNFIQNLSKEQCINAATQSLIMFILKVSH